MAILKVYVKSLVKSEEGFDEALNYCKGKLQNYFTNCVRHTNNRLFSAAEVSLTPHSRGITDLDLLVYIVASRDSTVMPGVVASPDAAGRTYSFPDGVISEIFANRAMNDGKLLGMIGGPFANRTRQGIALANLAFHELAHNKWFGFPDEEKARFRVDDPENKTHAVGGVMGTGLNNGFGNLNITPQNINVMAAMLQYPVPQSTNIDKYYF